MAHDLKHCENPPTGHPKQAAPNQSAKWKPPANRRRKTKTLSERKEKATGAVPMAASVCRRGPFLWTGLRKQLGHLGRPSHGSRRPQGERVVVPKPRSIWTPGHRSHQTRAAGKGRVYRRYRPNGGKAISDRLPGRLFADHDVVACQARHSFDLSQSALTAGKAEVSLRHV